MSQHKNEAECCQFLDWDTEFFGFRIARVISHHLTEQLLEEILAWCASHTIECLYFLANADDPTTIRIAEDCGFRLVEIRLIMERWLTDWNPETRPKASKEITIRHARAEDIPTLQEIAKTSYPDSRFYFDPCFTETQWREYYATWIRKSCEGGAELALVAELNGKVVGYITGKLEAQNRKHAQYELTGVKPEVRGSGIGQELFRSGLDWFARAGVEYVWLATQGRNIATQRMVQRNGFITRSCQLYYHKWFSPCKNQRK